AAGGLLETRNPSAEEAGGRLEDERIEGADLGNEISTSSNEGEGQLQQHLGSSGRSRDRPIELLSKGRLVAEYLRPPRDDRDEGQVCPSCEGTNTKAMFSTFAVVGTAETSSASTSGGCACGGSCACSN